MIDREVKILLRKEWKQLVHKRSALVSAVLLPLLLLGVVPAVLTLSVTAGGAQKPGSGPPIDIGIMGEVGQDPKLIAGAMMALFVSMAGLIVPMMMATHLLINERERRTLDLYVTLPVRIQQIVTAKLLATVLVAATITAPLVVVSMIAMPLVGVAKVEQIAALPLLLVAAIAFSTSASLLMSLLAKDFRTANNLGGALLGPAILAPLLATALLPGGVVRPLVIAALYLVGAVVLLRVTQKRVTVERLLS